MVANKYWLRFCYAKPFQKHTLGILLYDFKLPLIKYVRTDRENRSKTAIPFTIARMYEGSKLYVLTVYSAGVGDGGGGGKTSNRTELMAGKRTRTERDTTARTQAQRRHQKSPTAAMSWDKRTISNSTIEIVIPSSAIFEYPGRPRKRKTCDRQSGRITHRKVASAMPAAVRIRVSVFISSRTTLE